MQRITLVTPDRTGLLAAVSGVLSAKGINIESITARPLGADAVVHLQVDDPDGALAALTAAGYKAMPEEVITLSVVDQPGALARLSRRLSDAGIDIRGISMVDRSGDHAIVALSTDDDDAARALLADVVI